MKYVSTHERKSRGGAVHRTQEEKQKVIEKETKAEKKQEIRREEVESKFLIPKSQNFVETQIVKNYERRIEMWLRNGYPVHIIGPTGCGKTALAIRVAEKLGKPAVWINGDEAITTTDLIGGYSKVEMSSIRDKYIHNVYKDKDVIEPLWVSNPLTLACSNGYTLIYNEFSRTRPESNNVLLSILEEGILELPTKFGEERYIKVHPNFSVILTSNNIEYAGVHKPQDALLDRMPAIHMNYYDKETEIQIVKAHSKASRTEAEKIVDLIRNLRGVLNGAEKPGIRPAIMIAKAIGDSNGYSKEFFEQICVDAIGSKFRDFEDVENKRRIIRGQVNKLK